MTNRKNSNKMFPDKEENGDEEEKYLNEGHRERISGERAFPEEGEPALELPARSRGRSLWR